MMAHLVWSAVVCFVVIRTEAVVRHWLALVHPPERIAEEDLVVPADIVALAMRESEEWAQEEVLKAARERYMTITDAAMPESQKWNLVRRALGVGELA
jgi:hypothetical protein